MLFLVKYYYSAGIEIGPEQTPITLKLIANFFFFLNPITWVTEISVIAASQQIVNFSYT